jgi:bacteriocin biosynthesis cyclodehydratase domain-containing protein
MRPKLRADVRYVPAGDGVQVFSAAGSFGLTGASIQPLLDQLVGYLDGSHTLDSIVAGLPERHRRVVTKLIDTLVACRAVYDAAAVLPHRLADWELARYQQEVAFAELASGSGAHWFERFRLARVLLIGAGGTLDALAGTMLQLGARGAAVLDTSGSPAGQQRRRDRLATARAGDPRLTLAELPDPGRWGSVAEVRSWLAGYQAVLYAEDRSRPARAALLTRAARAAGIPALHALVGADHAWVGPAATGDQLGCWECGWRYLIGARSRADPDWPELQLADPPGPEPGPAAPPLRNLVGAMLAMAYFRLVTEGGSGGGPVPNQLIQVDLAAGTAQAHRFARHPACQACGEFPPPSPDLRAGPVRTDRDLSRAAAALHDPALGVLLSIDERDHQQLPLVVTVATVNDLTGSGAGPRTVTAAAPDHPRARQRAAVRAIETAAALVRAAAPPAGPDWGWPIPTAVEVDQAVVPVPEPVDPADRTVAAGYRWAEAVGRGLLRHTARLAVSGGGAGGVAGAGGSGRPLAEPDLPEDARRLVEAAAVLGARLQPVDRTGASGVPVVAVLGAGPDPVVAAGLELPDALAAALEAALARLQADPTGPTHPAGTGIEIPADLGDERWPDRLGWLAGRLAAAGWQALARPVTLEPALADRLPLLAEVSLLRRAG